MQPSYPPSPKHASKGHPVTAAYRGPIKVDWTARKDAVKAKWPTLTDADLNLTEGTYEELFARIEKRTGESPADIETAFSAIQGFGPAMDWDAVKAALRAKWPTLTESDLSGLAAGSRNDLIGRIQNRTSEKRETIDAAVEAAVTEATTNLDAAKAEAAATAASAASSTKVTVVPKDKLKRRWPALTDDDLSEGQTHDKLVAAIQKRTGETKVVVEKAIQDAR